jgi:cholest-4-en-3-one 26-monooxygenase
VFSDEIDLTDPDGFVEGVPHEWFAKLRKEMPVSWQLDPSSARGGFWAVVDYETCVSVNRDYESFSSARAATLFGDFPPEVLQQQQMMMLNMDPPMHTRYRRLVNKGFTPRMIRDLRVSVEQTTDAIIDEVCERGRADFVVDIAAELPLSVIAEMMGVPHAERRMLFDWSNRMVGAGDPEYFISEESATQAALELFAYADELCAAKLLDPHDDLFSVLTQAELDGDKLSPLELDLFFMLLAVAGNETTRNLIAGAMVAFFEHPDQWQLLAARPELMNSAIEECLRWVSPVMHFRRTATRDLVLGGQQVCEGDKVVFWHVSANRDEKVFANPDVFDITRSPNAHIAFGGGGPHFCLGANLARMEIEVMFTKLLMRLPDISQSGPAERLRSNFINGIKHLPVEFDERGRVGVLE